MSSHNDADCRAQHSHGPAGPPAGARPPVAARVAQSVTDAAPENAPLSQETEGRAPTHEQLLSLWETTYGTREVPDSCATGFRGQVATPATPSVAPKQTSSLVPTQELRKRAPTNERVRGRQIDMPLGFLPRNLLKPIRLTRTLRRHHLRPQRHHCLRRRLQQPVGRCR